jgi:hypothetical protein
MALRWDDPMAQGREGGRRGIAAVLLNLFDALAFFQLGHREIESSLTLLQQC